MQRFLTIDLLSSSTKFSENYPESAPEGYPGSRLESSPQRFANKNQESSPGSYPGIRPQRFANRYRKSSSESYPDTDLEQNPQTNSLEQLFGKPAININF